MVFWVVVALAVVLLLGWALWRDHRRPGMSVRGTATSTQHEAMAVVEEHHRRQETGGIWAP